MNLADCLLDKLVNLKYTDKTSRYEFHVLQEIHVPIVKTMICETVLDFNIKNAELEAKVKAYEAIIANSNFNTVIESERKRKEAYVVQLIATNDNLHGEIDFLNQQIRDLERQLEKYENSEAKKDES